MVNLSAWRAVRGSNSQISMPATLVAIGLNSPRISLGASGFHVESVEMGTSSALP